MDHDRDREIAFPPPPNLRSVPRRGVLAAVGLGQLRRTAPAGGTDAPLFQENLSRLCVGHEHFLAGPALGAPMAVMVLENLIWRGAGEIIFIGLAGSLVPSLEIGDLFCPEAGLSTEGTSAHYPAPLAPDPDLRRKMLDAAGESDKISGGTVWSTDGIYRETEAMVERHRSLGASAVEMECTALWAASAFRGVRLASLLVISDVLEGGEHRVGFGSPALRRGLNRAAELAWRALGVVTTSGRNSPASRE